MKFVHYFLYNYLKYVLYLDRNRRVPCPRKLISKYRKKTMRTSFSLSDFICNFYSMSRSSLFRLLCHLRFRALYKYVLKSHCLDRHSITFVLRCKYVFFTIVRTYFTHGRLFHTYAHILILTYTGTHTLNGHSVDRYRNIYYRIENNSHCTN